MAQAVKYFILYYKLHLERRYLIWVSGKKDVCALDESGHIPTFSDKKSLLNYARQKGYAIETEKPILNDLDYIVSWLRHPNENIHCEKMLNAWNLFSDIAATFPKQKSGFKKIDKRFPKIYSKLFRGSDIPCVTPKREIYIPRWSNDELKSISRVMHAGIDLFVNSTRKSVRGRAPRMPS